jgi:hypothetical protein
MIPTTRDSLEEYDEEVGLINIENSRKCCKCCSIVIYTFIMITLSVFFLLALYYKLILFITDKDKIVDCSNGALYLCGILVFPFIVLFAALNEFIDVLKKY